MILKHENLRDEMAELVASHAAACNADYYNSILQKCLVEKNIENPLYLMKCTLSEINNEGLEFCKMFDNVFQRLPYLPPNSL